MEGMWRDARCWLGMGLCALGLFSAGLPRARADRGAAQHRSDALALLTPRSELDADDAPSRRHRALHDDADDDRDRFSAVPLTHKVALGETLSAIAKHYGVALQQVLDLNPGLTADKIREGQNITIGLERRSLRYGVQRGDTLSGIAKQNEVTLAELKRWNPRLDPDHIREGQVLAIYPKKPPSLSESIGTPAGGQLVHARMLSSGPGYLVRAPERAYATDETVRGIVAAFTHLREVDPKAPTLWVHDLSLKRGGPINEHRSHQSGRDADIAYPQKHCDGPCGFRRLVASEIDAPRTFALLKYWLEHDLLEAVFIDYRLQAPLYQYARSQGASAEQLRRWFQYPNGAESPLGVIRHYRKHDDHMHVRFLCHASDHECKTYRPFLVHSAAR